MAKNKIDEFLDEPVSDVDAFLDAPSEKPVPQPQGFSPLRALLTNEPTSGFAEGMVRSIPATIGAGIGAVGGMGLASIPGATAGGMAGESIRQALSQAYAAKTGGRFATPGEVVFSTLKGGAEQGVGKTIGVGAGAIGQALRPSAIKTGSQAIRALTGVPQETAAKVLDDPSILSRAMGKKAAGEAYKAGVGGLEAGAAGSRKLFGKSYLSPEKAADAFDELWPSAGAMTDDEILTMRQVLSGAIKDTPYDQGSLKRILIGNLKQVDDVLENRLPDWSGAKQAYREYKIGEEFSSWLPLNKNLSPNVLRTTAGMAAAGSGIAGGSLLPAMALPAISPRAWGYGIRAASAISPSVMYGAGAATRMGAGGVSDYYMRNRQVP